MDNKYPSNSENNRKMSNKHLTAVTNGKMKKDSWSEKIVNAFLPCERENLGEWLVFDMLIPMTKNVVSDVIKGMLNSWTGGNSSKWADNSSFESRNSYSSYYDRTNKQSAIKQQRNRPNTHYGSTKVFWVPSREAAEDVMKRMEGTIDEFQMITVADTCDLIGVSANYTDTSWGWETMRGARYVAAEGGGVNIIMPSPRQID